MRVLMRNAAPYRLGPDNGGFYVGHSSGALSRPKDIVHQIVLAIIGADAPSRGRMRSAFRLRPL